MFKILRNWFISAAGKISIIMLFLSLVLIYIASSNHIPPVWISGIISSENINNILFGVSTNFIGIIFTVSFVQYFIDRQNENAEQLEEVAKINRFNQYLLVLIDRYLRIYISVTTRIADRAEVNIDKVFERRFEFSDMADMYKSSMYIHEGLLKPSIALYYQAENDVRDYMLKMLENIDFKYNSNIAQLLLAFTTNCKEFDMSGEMLGNINVYSHTGSNGKQEPLSEYISKCMAEDSGEWIKKFMDGKLERNFMTPYIVFYFKIKERVDIIKKYKECINNIGKL